MKIVAGAKKFKRGKVQSPQGLEDRNPKTQGNKSSRIAGEEAVALVPLVRIVDRAGIDEPEAVGGRPADADRTEDALAVSDVKDVCPPVGE